MPLEEPGSNDNLVDYLRKILINQGGDYSANPGGESLTQIARKILRNQISASPAGGSSGPQSANAIFAGPAAGADADPTFRAMVNADLANFASGTFTPEFSFSNPGDLAVAYNTRSGNYRRVGPLVWIDYRIQFTPTFGTASGLALFRGLPFAPDVSAYITAINISNSLTFPGSTTSLKGLVSSPDNGIIVQSEGSAVGAQAFGTTPFASGAEYSVRFGGVYSTAA